MACFQVVPSAVAVSGDRLVVIIGIDLEGIVTVRDLANGKVCTTSATDLKTPPPEPASQGSEFLVSKVSEA